MVEPEATESRMKEVVLLGVSDALAGQRWQRRTTRLRLVSIFCRRWITILVALLEQTPLPLGAFRPEPWLRVPGLAAHRVVLDPEVQHHAA
jgi:hypothetical protein